MFNRLRFIKFPVRLIRGALFMIFILCGQSAVTISMHVFDVGPGNFVVFKNGQRAFVVDCGTQQSDISDYLNDGAFLSNVRAVFDNVRQIKIAVTHPHVDHYGLIRDLFINRTLICDSAEKIKGILLCSNREISGLADLSNLIRVTNISDVSCPSVPTKTNADVVRTFLLDALYEIQDVNHKVEAIMVDHTFAARDVHDFNLMFKITDGSNKFLLPGDASASLIAVAQRQNPTFLRDINVFLWSHHGSFKTGQEVLASFTNSSAISIISSYPKETWLLPKRDILPFCTPIKLNNLAFCIEHELWYARDDGKISKYKTCNPFFITSEHRKSDIGHDHIKCISIDDGILSLSYNSKKFSSYCSIDKSILKAEIPSYKLKSLNDLQEYLFCSLLVKYIIGLHCGVMPDEDAQTFKKVLLFLSNNRKYPLEFVEKIIGVEYASPHNNDLMIYFRLFSQLGLCDLPSSTSSSSSNLSSSSSYSRSSTSPS